MTNLKVVEAFKDINLSFPGGKRCIARRKGVRNIKGCNKIKKLDEFPLVTGAVDNRGHICAQCLREHAEQERTRGFTIVRERLFSERISYDNGRKPMPPMWAEYLSNLDK